MLRHAPIIYNLTQHLAAGTEAYDYENKALKHLMDRDSSFLGRYVLYMKDKWERSGSGRAMNFIWSRPDAEELLENVAEQLVEANGEEQYFHEPFSRFFIPIEGDPTDTDTLARQDAFLCDLVGRYSTNKRFLTHVFQTAQDLGYERQRKVLACFLQVNNDLKLFSRYALASGPSSWTGSRVPLLKARIGYLRSLLPLLEGLDYLDHRARIEREIASEEQRVVYEKKRDFLRD